MVIAQKLFEFRATQNQSILAGDLDYKTVEGAAMRMLGDKTFRTMCDGMSAKELSEKIEAGGLALAQNYNAAKARMAQGGQPDAVKPAPSAVKDSGKNGPENVPTV
jgi:hypothetical protein